MHGEGLSEQVRRGLEGSIQDQEFEENRGFVKGSKEEGGKSSIGLPDLADLE